jgi:ATP-binding cassette subfamily C (CFTR/MRP) protein 10
VFLHQPQKKHSNTTHPQLLIMCRMPALLLCRLRAGVMGVLFRTALLGRAADAAGDVNTLMAVDAGRLANLCVSLHELWALPLQIAAAMWLLYVQVSSAQASVCALMFMCG